MKIEIVEYYPYEGRDDFSGTLHVYYVDKAMDIRGINCFKINGKWRIQMPYIWGVDFETKKRVRYPIINFIDENEQKQLSNLIWKQGKAYIKEKLKSEKPD